MFQPRDLAATYPDIANLLRERSLTFPILTKQEFIDQMVAGGAQIVFRGIAYDTRFGAGLVPEFFFPLLSSDDLILKAAELVVSRGLLPLPPVEPASGEPGA